MPSASASSLNALLVSKLDPARVQGQSGRFTQLTTGNEGPCAVLRARDAADLRMAISLVDLADLSVYSPQNRCRLPAAMLCGCLNVFFPLPLSLFDAAKGLRSPNPDPRAEGRGPQGQPVSHALVLLPLAFPCFACLPFERKPLESLLGPE